MLKSKIAFTLTFSLLFYVSMQTMVCAGKKREIADFEVDINKKQQKQLKGKREAKRELKLAKLECKRQIKRHNKTVTYKPQTDQTTWGKLQFKDVWATVGRFCSLREFVILFSTNKAFIALGEQLIQERAPFSLPAPFSVRSVRPFTMSHLMRYDLSADFGSFQECLGDFDPGPDDEGYYIRRSHYYETVHPLMASYYRLLESKSSAFVNEKELELERKRFLKCLHDQAQGNDTLALEMLVYSTLLSEDPKESLLERVFPKADNRPQDALDETLGRLYAKKAAPDYLSKLATLVLSQDFPDNDEFRTANLLCKIWGSVAPHVLDLNCSHYYDENMLERLKTHKATIAKQAILRVVTNPDWCLSSDGQYGFCPSIIALKKLVQVYLIYDKSRPFFHPEYYEEIENCLLRILAFSRKEGEYDHYIEQKYNDIDFEDEDVKQAAMLKDDSLGLNLKGLEKFALTHLQMFYFQSGDQNKLKHIFPQIQEAGHGFSMIGNVFYQMHQYSQAIHYYDRALANGEEIDLRHLLDATARQLQFKIDYYLWNNIKTEDILYHAFTIYRNHGNITKGLEYLLHAIPNDVTGRYAYYAAEAYFALGNQEKFDEYLTAAETKNHIDACTLINAAKHNGVTPFEQYREEKRD